MPSLISLPLPQPCEIGIITQEKQLVSDLQGQIQTQVFPTLKHWPFPFRPSEVPGLVPLTDSFACPPPPY